MHEMDGPSPGDMKTRIFNELDVFGNIEFIRIPEFYHFVSDHLSITIPHDPEEAIKDSCERNFLQRLMELMLFMIRYLIQKENLPEVRL